MKKAFLITLALIMNTPTMYAVDAKKIAYSLLKCSWHLTKIGAGVLCLGTSTIPFGTSLIAYSIPQIPELTNSPDDNKIVHDYLVGLAEEIKQTSRIVITPEHIEQAEQWYANNQPTVHEWSKHLNGLKSWVRNRAAVIFIGYCAASGTCIWSGAKGLYDEVTSFGSTDDTESDDTSDNATQPI